MILHMYNIILKAKQESLTGPDLCSEKNYFYRSKLRKGKFVELGGKPSNWTGKEEKNYKTHNLEFSHLTFCRPLVIFKLDSPLVKHKSSYINLKNETAMPGC